MKITVLGSTGSIGTQTLEVVRAHKDEFSVAALSAGRNSALLLEQIREFRPKLVSVSDDEAYREVKASLPSGVELISGADAASEVASGCDATTVVHGISGFAGTLPLIAALRAGKRVALANKESIVCARSLVKEAERAGGGYIVPVDSEQSAIFQCLCAGDRREVRRLILTASGGPFREYSLEELVRVTAKDAMRHPTWKMGRKVTLDSATLFNKGLEIMEASALFDMPSDSISVLIHPESIVHSLVEYCDSSVIAQLASPDMRLAIHYALTYPKRRESDFGRLDLASAGQLSFFEPDNGRFPALALAYAALEAGGIAPAVYNGANEAAGALFMEGAIGFLDIAALVAKTMDELRMDASPLTLEAVLEADARARKCVYEAAKHMTPLSK